MSTANTPKGAAGLRTDDAKPQTTHGPVARTAGGVAGWVDDRTGAAKPMSYLLKKVFPDHWSFMLGEIAMYSLVILLLTGTFLTFWFVPSSGLVPYDGSYIPLKGVVMSEAYRSALNISFGRAANSGPSTSPSETVRPPASTTAIVCAAASCRLQTRATSRSG